jgi:hypothetical protein
MHFFAEASPRPTSALARSLVIGSSGAAGAPGLARPIPARGESPDRTGFALKISVDP